jgi:5-methylcytosine-specific restriction protein A
MGNSSAVSGAEKCLNVFADAIDRANGHGRDIWAVTQAKGKVRLIVGHVIVCTLKNRPEHGPLRIALDKKLLGASSDRFVLERSDEWEWDTVSKNREYPSILSRNGFYRPSGSHARLWPTILEPLFFESIFRAATQTTMDSATPKGHTPEILGYLRDELRRPVPDPLY